MGSGIAVAGMLGVLLGIVGAISSGEAAMLILVPIGIILFFVGVGIENDDQTRHQRDYGKTCRCPKCNSDRVYFMTYDDKRSSIAFWGAASSKIGKCFHCDDCGYEW